MKTRTLTRWVSAAAVALALAGCASTNSLTHDPRDPFEGYNRAMFSFNQRLDRHVLKPVATAYSDYVPGPVQAGVGNFFANLEDVWTALNNFMQGKPADGTTDVLRFTFNSTFGLAGLIDVSTPIGLPKHDEDFGQTLGVWGVKSGPYVVLPVYGSSTLRDTFAKAFDIYADPLYHVDDVPFRNGAVALRVVDDRSAALGTISILEDAALDQYQFTRDAYLQRRESRVRDGRSAPYNAGEDK